MKTVLIPESVSPAGLRTRAFLVREMRSDPIATARHLELAADELERLLALTSENET